MANSGLKGPFKLTSTEVDKNVRTNSMGAYALGRSQNGTFFIDYVGRSDSDLHGRLKQHIEKYTEFKFDYFPSTKSAFEKECNLWHDFDGPKNSLDNKVHPDRPNGSGWQCPCCKIFS